jgi:flagellin
MAMVINTNVPSVTSQRHLEASRSMMERAMERLSSGKRINSAMDDAAGLSITHSLDKRIVSLQMGARNANDAISLIHLAEGALQEVSSMLVRMRELSTQATNSTYTQTDRSVIDDEIQQLKAEITRISDNTYFNGITVIGTAQTLSFQVGYDTSDVINLTTQDMEIGDIGSTYFTSGTYTVTSSTGTSAVLYDLNNLEVSTLYGAKRGLTIVDNALAQVDAYRSKLGAVGNRLDHTASNLATRIENQMAARSRIEDADYSVESAELAKNQVLQQAGTAMLAQANAQVQNVLSLLK